MRRDNSNKLLCDYLKDMGHNEDEAELGRLLQIVSEKGLKALDLVELDRLRILLQAKDYANDKKAKKSKAKLLRQINSAFYDSYRPRRFL
jgi:hypothetical protein